MVEKLMDAANFLKAKIKRDQLEENLLEVTSEENWQASSNQLHQIANAAYNYQNWQKINDFIWDKLKKSKSWRKILKTLSLVEFLLKNGPPSIISSYKYDIYQFRSFDSYSSYSDGLDRGQSIREKAKHIVQLLSNQELLQQERVKAKTIRQRMANVVGDRGMHYGGYSSSSTATNSGWGNDSNNSKYQSYNNKNYDPNSLIQQQYGGLGQYGDYNYNKSTLDKYKDGSKKTNQLNNTSTSLNNSYNTQKNQQQGNNQAKKPFQKLAPKLIKPGNVKPQPKIDSPKKVTQPPKTSTIDQDFFNNSTPTSSQKDTNSQQKKNGFEIDDILGTTNNQKQPQQPQKQQQQQQVQYQTQQTQQTQQIQQTQQTQQQQFQHQQFQPQIQPQQYQQPQQFQQFQPMQQYQQPQQFQYPQQQFMVNNQNFMQYPSYQQPNYQQTQPGTFGYPNYIGSPTAIGQNYPAYQNQNQFNQNQNYQTPMYPNVQVYPQQLQAPILQTQTIQQPQKQQITLSVPQKSRQEQQFGGFESANSNSQNVKWLSKEQKNLTDFSDFGVELKQDFGISPSPKNSKNNDIKIDMWNW